MATAGATATTAAAGTLRAAAAADGCPSAAVDGSVGPPAAQDAAHAAAFEQLRREVRCRRLAEQSVSLSPSLSPPLSPCSSFPGASRGGRCVLPLFLFFFVPHV